MESQGYRLIGEDGVLKVCKGSLVIIKGHRKTTNMYFLEGSTVTGNVVVVKSTQSDENITKLWHMRLGHMSEQGMKELSKKGLLDGMNSSNLEFCEHCLYGKHVRFSFSVGQHKSTGILDYIHADIWGPSTTPSHGGASYMLTFIDDHSRKVWAYFLKNKSDAFVRFKEWKIMVEKQTSESIKVLRTDNGIEFCSNLF